jgi:hypothetical protein
MPAALRDAVAHVLDRRRLPGLRPALAADAVPGVRRVSPHKQWYREPTPEREEKRERKRTPEPVA